MYRIIVVSGLRVLANEFSGSPAPTQRPITGPTHRTKLRQKIAPMHLSLRQREFLKSVYTIQPVVKPVVQPVWQRVVCFFKLTGCSQLSNRLYNRTAGCQAGLTTCFIVQTGFYTSNVSYNALYPRVTRDEVWKMIARVYGGRLTDRVAMTGCAVTVSRPTSAAGPDRNWTLSRNSSPRRCRIRINSRNHCQPVNR